MHDPILEEIWRVRAELLKKYGGFEGVFKEAQKIERARRAQMQRKPKKPTRKPSTASR